MRYFLTIILSICLCLGTCNANEHHNNEISNQVQHHKSISHTHSHEIGSFKIFDTFEEKIEDKLAEITHKIEDTKSPLVILFGVFLAILFGMFHALGPGYGKSVIFSYFLSQKEKWWKVPIMALQISTTHVISATILVLIANTAIKTLLPSTESQMLWLKLISYSLITLIGIYMIINKMKNKSCDCCCHNHIKPESLAVSTGLVPCPGTMLILLFAMAHKILWLGVLLVIFKGIGIALTLTIVGLLGTVTNKKLKIINPKWITPIEFIGPILITIIGIFLFASTIL